MVMTGHARWVKDFRADTPINNERTPTVFRNTVFMLKLSDEDIIAVQYSKAIIIEMCEMLSENPHLNGGLVTLNLSFVIIEFPSGHINPNLQTVHPGTVYPGR